MRCVTSLFLLLCVLGCDERGIEHYEAPKQARPTLIDAAQQPVPTARVDTPLTWTLPPGWTQQADPGAMRVASFTAADGQVTIAITVFPGDVGGELANVNRWRQQINLEPAATLDDQPIERYDVAGRAVYQLTLDGLRAAGVRDGERTWFIKMTGPAERVAAQADAFVAFVRALRWDQPGEGETRRGGEGEIAP